MRKFKIGDKVILREDSVWNNGTFWNPIKVKGKIVDRSHVLHWSVDWDNGTSNGYNEQDLDLAHPNPKVVIFNAPKGCGKDFMVGSLQDILEQREFKAELYKTVAKRYNIDPTLIRKLNDNRDTKEVGHRLLEGLSPRQAMIHVSEELIKPKYGKDYFGKALASTLEEGGVYGVSDGGFIEELLPVIEKCGKENVLIIRMFSDLTSFEGDSRRYLPDVDGVKAVNVYNDMTKAGEELVRAIVEGWLDD